MTRRAQAIAGLLTVGLAQPVEACDCLPAGGYTDQDIQSVLAKADAVVHAKVVSITADGEARIMIGESFGGEPSVLRAHAGDQVGCGTSFRAGGKRYTSCMRERSVCAGGFRRSRTW